MQTQVQSETTKKTHGIELIVVQCSVCICALIAALCLRMIGGNLYVTCTDLFHNAMTEHHAFPAPSANAKVYAVQQETKLQPQTTTVSSEADGEQQAVLTASTALVAAPLKGVLTSPFGERTDPFDSNKTSFHYGMDIAAEEGEPLLAMMNGTVAEVGYDEKGYGHYMKVERDNTHTYLYAHCSEVLCDVGETVEAGQMVARVGNTGRSTGSHVHIEWRVDGVPQDPSTVVPQEAYA